MYQYELDYYGFSNEDGDGCMAVFVDFPDVKGVGDTYEEAKIDAYEQLQEYFNKKGDVMEVRFQDAVDAYSNKEYEKAYTLFEDISVENPDAMVNLGIMHMKGFGCERDINSAKDWFEKAADKNHVQAINSLAHIYEKGMVGETDTDKALYYYKKAADLGNVSAQVKAGMLFKHAGKNVDAMRYLITAAHNNNEQAQEIITYVSNAGENPSTNHAFRTLDEQRQIALIQNLLEKNIRPSLAADGGGIDMLNYIPGDTPQVWLNYTGACSGCHLGSTSTAQMLLDNFETLIDKNVVLYLM